MSVDWKQLQCEALNLELSFDHSLYIERDKYGDIWKWFLLTPSDKYVIQSRLRDEDMENKNMIDIEMTKFIVLISFIGDMRKYFFNIIH